MHPLHLELRRWHFPNRYFPLNSSFLEEAFVLFKQSHRLCLQLLMDKKHETRNTSSAASCSFGKEKMPLLSPPGKGHQPQTTSTSWPFASLLAQKVANSPGLQQDNLVCLAQSGLEMTGEDEAILPTPPPPSFPCLLWASQSLAAGYAPQSNQPFLLLTYECTDISKTAKHDQRFYGSSSGSGPSMGSNYPRVPPQDIFAVPWKRKGARKSSGDVPTFGKTSTHKTVTRGMVATLLNPSWSSPWSPPFSPILGSRGTGARKRAGPHPSLLPERRKKKKARMWPGRPSVGCQRKVSIKAMRGWASLWLTGGLSGADSRSAGCLPVSLTGACVPCAPSAGRAPARPSVPCPAPRDAPDNGNYLDLGLKQATASLEADGCRARAAGARWDGTGRSWGLLK